MPALVFARLPVWSPGEHKVAADLGFGLLADGVEPTQTRIRPGLAWGRGFESRWGGGWLGMEASYEYPPAERRAARPRPTSLPA